MLLLLLLLLRKSALLLRDGSGLRRELRRVPDVFGRRQKRRRRGRGLRRELPAVLRTRLQPRSLGRVQQLVRQGNADEDGVVHRQQRFWGGERVHFEVHRRGLDAIDVPGVPRRERMRARDAPAGSQAAAAVAAAASASSPTPAAAESAPAPAESPASVAHAARATLMRFLTR
jgi:hypothetical protein